MLAASGFSVSTMATVRAISLAPIESMSRPQMLMLPPSLGCDAESVRSSVDLPAPLGPMRHVSLPPSTVAPMPPATVFVPLLVR